MTKPRLEKVEAFDYVIQQVTKERGRAYYFRLSKKLSYGEFPDRNYMFIPPST